MLNIYFDEAKNTNLVVFKEKKTQLEVAKFQFQPLSAPFISHLELPTHLWKHLKVEHSSVKTLCQSPPGLAGVFWALEVIQPR